MQFGTEEIDLLNISVDDINTKIFAAFPTPEKLNGVSLRFSLQEEAALDSVMGMMWPLLFTKGFMQRYETATGKESHISASISFPDDDTIELQFGIVESLNAA